MPVLSSTQSPGSGSASRGLTDGVVTTNPFRRHTSDNAPVHPLPAPDDTPPPVEMLLARLRGSNDALKLPQLREALVSSMPRASILPPALVTKLAEKLLQLADSNGDGQVSLDELQLLLQRYPKLIALLGADRAPAQPSVAKSAQTLVGETRRDIPPAAAAALCCRCPRSAPVSRRTRFWRIVMVAVCVVSAAAAIYRYAPIASPAGVAAHCGGALLYVAVALLQLSMLRRAHVALSHYAVAERALPLDLLGSVHIAAAVAVFAFLPLHVGGHIGDWLTRGLSAPYVFSASNPEGLAGVYAAAGTGVAIVGVMAVMVLGYLARVHWGLYSCFYVTHAVGVPFVWALFIVHAPLGWMVLGIPLLIFAVELGVRALQAWGPPLRVLSFALLPCGAVELRIQRPPGFSFLPGQFVWVLVPALGGRQLWHPFCISSPPEACSVLTLHIRVSSPNGWTAALRAYLEQYADDAAAAAADGSAADTAAASAAAIREGTELESGSNARAATVVTNPLLSGLQPLGPTATTQVAIEIAGLMHQNSSNHSGRLNFERASSLRHVGPGGGSSASGWRIGMDALPIAAHARGSVDAAPGGATTAGVRARRPVSSARSSSRRLVVLASPLAPPPPQMSQQGAWFEGQAEGWGGHQAHSNESTSPEGHSGATVGSVITPAAPLQRDASGCFDGVAMHSFPHQRAAVENGESDNSFSDSCEDGSHDPSHQRSRVDPVSAVIARPNASSSSSCISNAAAGQLIASASLQESPASSASASEGTAPGPRRATVNSASGVYALSPLLLSKRTLTPLVVRLEGPYPAPCQGVTSTRHAILVAAGIGVTPAAAILASILARARAGAAAAAAIGEARSSVQAVLWPLARLDFVWLANEGAQFSWLLPLLQRFEAEAANDPAGLGSLLRVHVYLTSLPDSSDPKTAMLHLALEALFEDEGCDVVVGLRGARMVPGRPAWRPLLQRLSREGVAALAEAARTAEGDGGSPSRAEGGCTGAFCPLSDAAPAEVFCCGPRALAASVAEAAGAAGLPFHPEPY